MARRKAPKPDDLLKGARFIRVATLSDLPLAEALQKALRAQGVGAVIINDEKFQARPDGERAAADVPEGFRIEVPEQAAEKARRILDRLQRDSEE